MFRRLDLAGAMLVGSMSLAHAQSAPGLSYGEVPTAAQWNNYFSLKQDFLGYSPLNRAGDTMTGKINFAPSTLVQASVNLPLGIDPTSPNNGDFWSSSSGLFFRSGNITFNLLSSSLSSVSLGAAVSALPTTEPATAGLAWNNNGVFQLSQ